MNSKLTLNIDRSVIEKAKSYAQEEGRSLSDLVESYLKIIVKKETDSIATEAPLTKSLRGTFKAPDNIDYKEALSKGLSEKYG
ncbi:MAG: hypothetical protein KDC79_07695 [Cyclobacteriaceae bacterium]|nr:hypothetical protein [Cyclobacteriaceae bacterium]